MNQIYTNNIWSHALHINVDFIDLLCLSKGVLTFEEMAGCLN